MKTHFLTAFLYLASQLNCITFLLLLPCPAHCLASNETQSQNATKENPAMFLPHLIPASYDANLAPFQVLLVDEAKFQVNISIDVMGIDAISEQDMSFSTTLYIVQQWTDPRLYYCNRSTIKEIVLTPEYSKRIWQPDTFFFNSKKVDFHKTIYDLDTNSLRIECDGTLTYDAKVSVVAGCSIDLTFFPVDMQNCTLSLTSYSHTVEYVWNKTNSQVSNQHVYLPTFRLLGYSQHSVIDNEDIKLHLDIFFSRSIAFYFTRIYLPACLVVIISFVPFWLPRESHARVGLGVTTVLTITTLITNTNSELPKISHLTALDVYLFFCFFLVFLSLIEYAVVGYYDMTKITVNEGEDVVLTTSENDNNGNAEQEEEGEEKVEEKQKKTPVNKADAIDIAARKLFPLVFGLFNALYVLALIIVVRNEKVDPELQYY